MIIDWSNQPMWEEKEKLYPQLSRPIIDFVSFPILDVVVILAQETSETYFHLSSYNITVTLTYVTFTSRKKMGRKVSYNFEKKGN